MRNFLVIYLFAFISCSNDTGKMVNTQNQNNHEKLVDIPNKFTKECATNIICSNTYNSVLEKIAKMEKNVDIGLNLNREVDFYSFSIHFDDNLTILDVVIDEEYYSLKRAKAMIPIIKALQYQKISKKIDCEVYAFHIMFFIDTYNSDKRVESVLFARDKKHYDDIENREVVKCSTSPSPRCSL